MVTLSPLYPVHTRHSTGFFLAALVVFFTLLLTEIDFCFGQGGHFNADGLVWIEMGFGHDDGSTPLHCTP
jgi:hypothetical protein